MPFAKQSLAAMAVRIFQYFKMEAEKAASILDEMELLRPSRIGLAPKLQWLGHHLPGNTDAAANYAKQQPKLLHIQ